MEVGSSQNTTDSGNNWLVQTEYRNALQISVSAFFLLFIILLALVGNIMVIVAVRSVTKLRQENSNIFIVNLSVTDLLSTVIVMLSSFTSLVSDKWPFGQVLCDFACAANYCFIIVSMLTLCFISLDRYQAVLYPLLYRTRMTQRRVITMIIYSWFQGTVFAFVPVIFRWVHYDYWEVICAIAWHKDPCALYYVIFAFLLCFLVPGIVLIVCYVYVLREARKCKIGSNPAALQNEAVRTSTNQAQVKVSRSNSKTIRSLIFVVFAYFICLTPFCVTKLLKVIFPEPDFLPGCVNLMASWFGYMSSAVNPLIYGIFRRDFRTVYIKMIKKLIFSDQGSPNNLQLSVLTTRPSSDS